MPPKNKGSNMHSHFTSANPRANRTQRTQRTLDGGIADLSCRCNHGVKASLECPFIVERPSNCQACRRKEKPIKRPDGTTIEYKHGHVYGCPNGDSAFAGRTHGWVNKRKQEALDAARLKQRCVSIQQTEKAVAAAAETSTEAMRRFIANEPPPPAIVEAGRRATTVSASSSSSSSSPFKSLASAAGSTIARGATWCATKVMGGLSAFSNTRSATPLGEQLVRAASSSSSATVVVRSRCSSTASPAPQRSNARGSNEVAGLRPAVISAIDEHLRINLRVSKDGKIQGTGHEAFARKFGFWPESVSFGGPLEAIKVPRLSRGLPVLEWTGGDIDLLSTTGMNPELHFAAGVSVFLPCFSFCLFVFV
jgi:hypothetical protein